MVIEAIKKSEEIKKTVGSKIILTTQRIVLPLIQKVHATNHILI